MRGFKKIEKKFPNEIDFDDFNEFWDDANCIDPLGVLERVGAVGQRKGEDQRYIAEHVEGEPTSVLAPLDDVLEAEVQVITYLHSLHPYTLHPYIRTGNYVLTFAASTHTYHPRNLYLRG
jgi:hypothetical protein